MAPRKTKRRSSARKKKKSTSTQPPKHFWSGGFKAWLLGSVFGVLLLGVIGNQLSASIPNPFEIAREFFISTFGEKEKIIWHAAGVKNALKHEVSLGFWSRSEKDGPRTWMIETLQPEETTWLVEDAQIYLMVQGEMVANFNPERMTHTYEGEEAYELECATFDSKPSEQQLADLKPNRIDRMFGSRKIIPFVDGSKVGFEMFGGSGKILPTVLPITAEGNYFYPFQQPSERNSLKISNN